MRSTKIFINICARFWLFLAACHASHAGSFTDVTSAAGFNGLNSSWGMAWADFDLDGDLDVLTHAHLQGITGSLTQLWRNNGDGTFTDVTTEVGLTHFTGDTHSAAWGDFNKDGAPDLYIVNGSVKTEPENYNKFFLNDGTGRFTEMAASSGLLGLAARGRGTYIFDYKNNGKIDIFSTSFNRPSAGADFDLGNLLLVNNGNLTFTDNGFLVGIDRPLAENRAAAWADFNKDGRVDLLITGPCILYAGNADGTFTDVTAAAGIEASDQCAAAAWGDYDNDGHIDLYISRGLTEDESDVLYRNNGNGTFTDVTKLVGMGDITLDRGVIWGDYDNDGDLDLYVVSLQNSSKPNRLYQNNGNGTFTEVAEYEGATAQLGGNGGADAAFVDYDNDGNLDLFITNGEGNHLGPYVLLHNAGNGNHWLKLKLIGKNSNRDGLMTRVQVQSPLGKQYLSHLGPHHFLSQSLMPLHIGLNKDIVVNKMIVEWPSGAKQKAENLGVNQIVTLEEGRPHWDGYATINQPGFYIGKSGKRWRITWKGESSNTQFSGRITTNGTFSSVASKSFEPADAMVLNSSSNTIDFSAFEDGNTPDAIEFQSSGTTITLDLKQDQQYSPQNVFLGKYLTRPAGFPLILRR